MYFMCALNESDSSRNILHYISNLAHSRARRQFGSQRGGVFRSRFMLVAIYPPFEVQITQFHVDKIQKRRKRPVIEHGDNIPVCILRHAQFCNSSHFISDVIFTYVASHADHFPGKYLGPC